ncbi:LCP family protein [Bifidobacterium aerophilum]|uniref:Transcriptional regulator n=1 Tax=Bifidobacterium aerophilum TaxID=1798155 RepID=A0A6N9Z2F8_9BIFI|nr:LCP family protein [Bifidobacterium aerophilum]NEG88768.1 transcriptional regulator [Bifidobacterium aerophilum]
MARRPEHVADLPNLGWRRSNMPHHTLGYRATHKVFTGISLAIVAVLAFVGTFAAATYADISKTIDDGKVPVIKQGTSGKSAEEANKLIDPYANQAIDILLIGQDTRDGGGNTAIGGDDAYTQNLHNSDTVLIMQISADRKTINLVSLPRDLMVDTPSCQTTNGEIPAQYSVQFNSIFANAYSIGGDVASAASCTLNAVNYMSGMDITNFMVIDFAGLVKMIDAIGGVDICLPTDMVDSYTNLNLKRGMNHLDGATATQYARTRHATGTDGSDTMRTTRQQYLIKKIISTALSKNYFTQTSELYQLAKAGLESVQMSASLADAMTLAGLGMSLKDFDMTHLYSQTIPVVPWTQDANRSQLADGAEAVWEKLRNHQPLVDQTDSSSKDSGSDNSNGSDNSGDTNSGDTTDNSGDTNSSTNGSADGSTSDGSTYNAQTGVTTLADGTLIDKETGGIIDPETGAIRDSATGQFIGLANRYIEVTYCGVK